MRMPGEPPQTWEIVEALGRDAQLRHKVQEEIRRDEGVTYAQLRERIWADPASISRVVEDLCDEGLILEESGMFWSNQPDR